MTWVQGSIFYTDEENSDISNPLVGWQLARNKFLIFLWMCLVNNFFFLPVCSVFLMLSFCVPWWLEKTSFQVFLCNGDYTFSPYTTKLHVTCGQTCRNHITEQSTRTRLLCPVLLWTCVPFIKDCSSASGTILLYFTLVKGKLCAFSDKLSAVGPLYIILLS